MARKIDSEISDIRAASRLLVRELGFMNRNIADTDLSPSSVHAIVEIGNCESLTSKDLGELLLLEKSTVSRLVKSLVKKGLLKESTSPSDAREKKLYLTASGNRKLSAINSYAEKRISSAITPLDSNSRESILKGMQQFSLALQTSRLKVL